MLSVVENLGEPQKVTIIEEVTKKHKLTLVSIVNEDLLDKILMCLSQAAQKKRAYKKILLIKKKPLENLFEKVPWNSETLTLLCHKYEAKLI